MIVRTLTVEDLPRLALLGEHFYREGKLPGRFVPAVFVATWTTFLEIERGILIGAEHDGELLGALGAVIAPDINDGETVANECFWFVRPDARGCGLRLFNEYERQARERGARRITMVHLRGLFPETLGALYERRGFRPLEVQYHKDLGED